MGIKDNVFNHHLIPNLENQQHLLEFAKIPNPGAGW
jgi:hypothetical protein